MLLVLDFFACLWTLGIWLVACETRRRGRRARQEASIVKERICPPTAKPVLVRILAGAEAGLMARLDELAPYSAKWGVPFALAIAQRDSASEVVLAWAARAKQQGLGPLAVIQSCADLRNRKVCQLHSIFAWAEAEHFTSVVCVDSDVLIDSVVLGRLCDRLSEHRVGASWQAFGASEVSSALPGRIECAILNASQHAMPLLARLDPQVVAGKVLALRLEAIRDIGGWAQFGGFLGEDLALAKSLAASNWQTRALFEVALTARPETTHKLLWERMVRWLGVIREQRPLFLVTYPLMFFYLPLQVTLLALVVSLGAPAAPAIFAGAVVFWSRWAIADEARAATLGRRGILSLGCDALLSDGYLLLVWLRVLAKPARRWRGHEV